MFQPDDFDDDGANTVFRDVIFLALAGFVAMVLLLLPHLNPPATAHEGTPAPGDVPVGYSNKGGVLFNLLRDDLGRQSDVTNVNYEVSYSRGIEPGEYVVNVHLYRDMSGQLPIPVVVSVSVKSSPETAAKRILNTKVLLHYQGEELTAFRFVLDKNGKLVPGSVNDLPKPLRSRKKA